MKSLKVYDEEHQWYLFGRDPAKPELIIDTNQYLIVNGDESILLDPGGVELFSPMLAAIMKFIDIKQLTHLFASHQDPDIISSLGMWDQILPNATLHSPWLWESFIRHFGMDSIKFKAIPDEGGQFQLGNVTLEFIPAHYLHSSGNFNVYDPKAKLLFSGDIGAALEKGDPPLFVEDFDSHIDKMKGFHQRWMPSNRAKQDWISRVRKLDVDIMMPQHGRLFKGKQVKQFLDWFEELEVGSAVS